LHFRSRVSNQIGHPTLQSYKKGEHNSGL
jgi:hypothetical protein